MDFLKSIHKIILIICGVAAGLGLLTMIVPTAVLYLICFLAAFAMVGIGVLRTRTYIQEVKVSRFAKVPNLVIGVSLILGGILFAFESSLMIVIVPVVLCLVVWAGAAYLAQRALEDLTRKKKEWWVQAALAGVVAVLAIVVSIQLKGNLQYILGTSVAGQFSGIAQAKDLFVQAMEANGISLTLWFNGLSMILAAIAVIASYVLPDFLKKV